MAKIRYDDWHEVLGQDLYVTVGTRLFIGEFLGLRPLSHKEGIGRRVELAWAILSLDGVVFFDPDNPAVVVHTSACRAKRIAAIPSIEDGSAYASQCVRDTAELLHRAHDAVTSASRLIERCEKRRAIADLGKVC